MANKLAICLYLSFLFYEMLLVLRVTKVFWTQPGFISVPFSQYANLTKWFLKFTLSLALSYLKYPYNPKPGHIPLAPKAFYFLAISTFSIKPNHKLQSIISNQIN